MRPATNRRAPSDHVESSIEIKRSKRSPSPSPKPLSKLIMKSTNVDDLPDFVLLEILCRLPQESAVRCMCVSKRLLGLISNPYFIRHFVRVQSDDNQKPIPRTLIFSHTRRNRRKFFSMSSEPDHPLFRTPRNFSLNFLPCFQDHDEDQGEPFVVGAYNDLVLCCATTLPKCDYYICNPYTKQWVALPPSSTPHKQVRVGFVCDRYSKNRKETTTQFDFNLEYRYKVVRILKPDFGFLEPSFKFELEIFSSETGKWTWSLVSSPKSFRFDSLALDPGVAYNGLLYWMSDNDGLVVGLDPYSKNINTRSRTRGKFRFCFFNKPKNEFGLFDFLGVCRGRLRMCQFSYFDDNGNRDIPADFRVWELRDDCRQPNEPKKWCLVLRVSLIELFLENPLITEIIEWRRQGHWGQLVKVLAFDPHDEDILYLQVYEHLLMYNIRTKTLRGTTRTAPCDCTVSSGKVPAVFPFALPWWPTPVLTSWTKSATSSSKFKSSGKRKSMFMKEEREKINEAADCRPPRK